MACNRKRQSMNNVGEDIISELPREILDYILERMPSGDVARTSMLSRKWRYIWTTHPQLKFDHQFYKEIKPFTLEKFVNVISKIFLLHNGPILKFHLRIPSSSKVQLDENSDIDHWMLILSRNGIKELDFQSSCPNPYKLPSYIFSCSQLTHLKLSNCIMKPPHAFKGFPNLISLYLDNIRFATTNILGTLFSSVPLLESLTIWGCSGIEHFNIYAPALKAMHIMTVGEFKSISLKNSPNLAVVSIAPCSNLDKPVYLYSGKTTNLIEFLASLRRIVVLLLDSFVLKVLVAGNISKRLPGVKNLKKICLITINFNDSAEISCIIWLLQHSTNLQELNIRATRSANTVLMQPVFKFLKEPCWKGLKVNTLRTVKLTLNKCLRAELIFIKFLLDRCLILERMSIEFSLPWVDANEGFRVLKEVMRFPRASQKAQVIFE